MNVEDHDGKSRAAVENPDTDQSFKTILEETENGKAQDISQPGGLDELLDERSLAEKYLATVLELEATKRELLEVRCLLDEREKRHIEEVAGLRTELLLENVVAGELVKRRMDQESSAQYQVLQASIVSRQEVSISSPTSVRDQLATSTPNTSLGTRTDVVRNNLSDMVAGETSFIGRIGSDKM